MAKLYETVEEAAEKYGVSPSTVRKWLRHPTKIPKHDKMKTPGNEWRIRIGAVERASRHH